MWSAESSREFEEIRVSDIRFLGEQNGPPERLLKNCLQDFFRHENVVIRAYLARADIGERRVGVVLCLRTACAPAKGMIEKIGAIFASIFGAKEHLDILFLTDEQEAQLTRVCKPFFTLVR